ncbi:MAG: sodium-dependent transporter [Firmicutes bacterium]|nr:sodium-dependent transporter [Bacillota bacterium]
MENKNRGSFSGSLGFILTAVGSAVGLGNLWGFPYKMGANGGFPFLIIYLVFVIFCGVVVMGLEMAIGRKTGKSPVLAMGELGKQYKFVGWLSVLCPIIISGFYSVLIGYSVRYAWGFLMEIFGSDSFGGMSGGDFFGAYTAEPMQVMLFTIITLAACGLIVAGGIAGGIEKFNKVGIPGLFVLLIVIIVYNFTLPGASQGLTYMFTSKGMEMAGTEFDFFNACRVAAGQMLFSCSLGMGIMITYGSYMKPEESISRNAWIIPAADTLAAIMAGLAIFPAVFAQGGTPNGGVGLLFITMHDTFTSMGNIGNVIGFLFYVLVIFAGVSSLISLMEVASAHFIDSNEAKGKPVSRKNAVLVMTVIIFVLSIPVCLDMLGGSAITTQIPLVSKIGCLVDTYDFFTEGIMMPLAAILMCLIVGWKKGHSWYEEEMEKCGNKIIGKSFFRVSIKYITPAMMTFVLISLALSYLGI